MMSCRACFLAVQPAIIKPIHKMMAEMNLAKYLPVARAKEMGSPFRSVTLRPRAILPRVAWKTEDSRPAQ